MNSVDVPHLLLALTLFQFLPAQATLSTLTQYLDANPSDAREVDVVHVWRPPLSCNYSHIHTHGVDKQSGFRRGGTRYAISGNM